MSTRQDDNERRATRRTRFTLAILRLYPRRWRARYEAEMRAILEDHGATTRDLVDLAWGAVRERWRGPHGPDPGDHPVAAAFWRSGVAFLERATIVTVAGAGAYGLGWVVGDVTGPASDGLVAIGLLGLIGWICAHVLYRAYRATKLLPAVPPPPKTPVVVRISQIAGGFFAAGLAITGAEHELPSWTTVANIYLMLTYVSFDAVLDRDGRRRRMADASQHYFGARERRKWATLELARLESLSLSAEHPDVVRQREEIAQREQQMASAVEILRHPDQPAADSFNAPAAP